MAQITTKRPSIRLIPGTKAPAESIPSVRHAPGAPVPTPQKIQMPAPEAKPAPEQPQPTESNPS